ncbi:GNAT family N-acetyltransferase [Paenibacillus caui]|uniref:GNAT family N-acetyltransferase n=1 Tax=Paenibacillus caui TaxID=2873927 RepID=UPI001CA851FF|nr:GNAT family N-acetyltransferase [Paenibacillus caui]
MKEILRTYKETPASSISSRCIPIVVKGTVRGRLRPITMDTIHNDAEIKMLTEWREASSTWFTTWFPVSEEGTRRWIEHQVVNADDRILFFVEDEELTPVGQVGLIHYDEDKKECEFDNLLRGRKGKFGNIMIYALIALGTWSVNELNLQKGYIHVMADNFRAIRIHQSLGAEEVERIPLIRSEENGVTRWVRAPFPGEGTPERELVTMVIKRETFIQILGTNFMN